MTSSGAQGIRGGGSFLQAPLGGPPFPTSTTTHTHNPHIVRIRTINRSPSSRNPGIPVRPRGINPSKTPLGYCRAPRFPLASRARRDLDPGSTGLAGARIRPERARGARRLVTGSVERRARHLWAIRPVDRAGRGGADASSVTVRWVGGHPYVARTSTPAVRALKKQVTGTGCTSLGTPRQRTEWRAFP